MQVVFNCLFVCVVVVCFFFFVNLIAHIFIYDNHLFSCVLELTSLYQPEIRLPFQQFSNIYKARAMCLSPFLFFLLTFVIFLFTSSFLWKFQFFESLIFVFYFFFVCIHILCLKIETNWTHNLSCTSPYTSLND